MEIGDEKPDLKTNDTPIVEDAEVIKSEPVKEKEKEKVIPSNKKEVENPKKPKQEVGVNGQLNDTKQAGRDIIINSTNYFTTEGEKQEASDKQEEIDEKNNIYKPQLITTPPKTIYKKYSNDRVSTIKYELDENPILIINSLDKDILYAAQHLLVEQLGGYNQEYQVFALPFLGNTKNLEIKDVIDLEFGLGRNTITFIEPHDSFFSKIDGNHASSIRKSLSNKNNLLVCLISKSQEEIDENFGYLKKEYQYWHIPFIDEMITHKFGHEAIPIIEKIKNTKSYHLKEEVVYKQIKSKLTEQNEAFLEFIDTLDEVIENDYEKRLQNLRKTFDDGDEIVRTVLFVSSFFTHLDFEEFNNVVNHLLGGQTSNNEKPIIGNKNVVTLLKTTPLLNEWVNHLFTTSIALKDKWERNSSTILKSCTLQYISVIENVYSVEFEIADLKADLRKYIENRYFPFVFSSYKKIHKLGLLFNLKLSDRLSKSIIFLTIYYSKYEKDYYNENWLIHIVNDIWKNLQAESLVEALKNADSDNENHWETFFKLVKNSENTKTAFNIRLATLIEEMFKQDADYFRPIVHQFLINLINNQEYQKIVLDIVLAISKKLEHKFEFDTGKYLKHLFNQVNVNDTGLILETYNGLFETFDIDDLKTYLAKWLPKSMEEVDENNHKLFAVIFQFDYTIISILQTEDKFIGEYRTNFSILKDLDKGNEALAKSIKWILDDKMEKAMSKTIAKQIITGRLRHFPHLKELNLDNYKFDSIAWLSDLIEFWFIILYGTEPNANHSEEQKTYIDLYIKTIKKQFNPIKFRSLKEKLAFKRKIYGNQISHKNSEIDDTKDREKKKELLAQKVHIKNMRVILEILRKQL
jgi:hypothetical protein